MSWYDKKLIKISEEIQKSNQSPFMKKGPYNIESFVFMITNMKTNEDFVKIREEFLKVNGVKEVTRLGTKKIMVEFDNRKVGLEHLTTALRKTGYKYLNRACRNCVKK